MEEDCVAFLPFFKSKLLLLFPYIFALRVLMGMKFLEKKVMENRFFGSNHIGRNDVGRLFVFLLDSCCFKV
jgi:hypothetical protein